MDHCCLEIERWEMCSCIAAAPWAGHFGESRLVASLPLFSSVEYISFHSCFFQNSSDFVSAQSKLAAPYKNWSLRGTRFRWSSISAFSS
jgi:hypothetical protein